MVEIEDVLAESTWFCCFKDGCKMSWRLKISGSYPKDSCKMFQCLMTFHQPQRQIVFTHQFLPLLRRLESIFASVWTPGNRFLSLCGHLEIHYCLYDYQSILVSNLPQQQREAVFKSTYVLYSMFLVSLTHSQVGFSHHLTCCQSLKHLHCC